MSIFYKSETILCGVCTLFSFVCLGHKIQSCKYLEALNILYVWYKTLQAT